MISKLLKQVEPSIQSAYLLSVPEASRTTGITERTIWRMIRQRELNAWGPPRCYRIPLFRNCSARSSKTVG